MADDAQAVHMVRKVVHAFADWQQKWLAAADGWMGRRLWRAFDCVGGKADPPTSR